MAAITIMFFLAVVIGACLGSLAVDPGGAGYITLIAAILLVIIILLMELRRSIGHNNLF